LVSFHNFAEFIGVTGFKAKFTKSTNPKFTWTWARPRTLSANLGDFAVRTSYSLSTSDIAFSGDRQMTERAWLEISGATPLPVQEAYAGPIASLRYLVQLSVGHELPLVSLHGQKGGKSGRWRRIVDQSAIFFEEKRSLPLPKRAPPPRLLFTLQEFGSNAEYLARRHEGFTLFRDALDFYFSLDPRADSSVAIEHHFLNAINAIEAYHRRKGNTRYELDPARYEERLERIINAAPARDRPWLRGKLRYSNEVTLRTRLRELFEQMPRALQQACGGRKQFVDTVVTTRNYLIHHDDESKGRSAFRRASLVRNGEASYAARLCVLPAARSPR
jgi:hypothetical protein